MFNIVFIVLLLFEYMAFVVGYNFHPKIGREIIIFILSWGIFIIDLLYSVIQIKNIKINN